MFKNIILLKMKIPKQKLLTDLKISVLWTIYI